MLGQWRIWLHDLQYLSTLKHNNDNLVGGFSQLGLLFPIYGNKKNCPNHQPDDVDLPHAALEHVLFQHLTAENPRILMENPWGQMSALHLSLAA